MADQRQQTQQDRLAQLEAENVALTGKLAELEARARVTPPPPFPENREIRCERTGGHVVRAKTWPPHEVMGTPGPNNPPAMPLTCERCGCWVIVYDRPQATVRVIKPEPVEAK